MKLVHTVRFLAAAAMLYTSLIMGARLFVEKALTIEVPVAVSEPEKVVEAWEKLTPALIPICSCESTGRPDLVPRQFGDDGKPLLGKVNPSDIGMCQINRYWHEAEAIKRGIDLATAEGNVEFANLLYAREGTVPWNWSKATCWGK